MPLTTLARLLLLITAPVAVSAFEGVISVEEFSGPKRTVSATTYHVKNDRVRVEKRRQPPSFITLPSETGMKVSTQESFAEFRKVGDQSPSSGWGVPIDGWERKLSGGMLKIITTDRFGYLPYAIQPKTEVDEATTALIQSFLQTHSLYPLQVIMEIPGEGAGIKHAFRAHVTYIEEKAVTISESAGSATSTEPPGPDDVDVAVKAALDTGTGRFNRDGSEIVVTIGRKTGLPGFAMITAGVSIKSNHYSIEAMIYEKGTDATVSDIVDGVARYVRRWNFNNGRGKPTTAPSTSPNDTILQDIAWSLNKMAEI